MGNVYFGGQKVCPVLKINDYQPTIEPLSVTPTTSEQTITAPAGTDGYSPITVDAVDASIDSNIAAGNIKSGVTILGVTGNVVQSNTTTLSVTPTTSAQSLSPSSPYNGYSSVSVAAVTAAIDPDIIASNIKSGVNILGVNGTVTELQGETRSVSLTDEAGQTFTPTSGKNGITSITVTPNNKDQSITPTTSAQSISVPSGYSGNGDISVSAVTSSIDANIQPENIIDGVTILGVTGTYEPTLITKSITENGTYTASSDNADGYSSVSVDVDTVNNTTLSVTPSTSAQSFSPSSPYTGYGSVSVDAVDSTIDANIQAGNIKSGVSILGVTGNVVQLNGTTKTITPSTTSQTVTPTSPSNGFTSVTVPAVTSAIDSNIQAGNIVDGVTILGVTGTAEESNPTTLEVTPTTSAQTLTPTSPYNGFDEVNVAAVTSSIDSNIAAGNIKSGVKILGVSGTVTELKGETRSVSITSTAGNTFTPSEGKNGITSITVTPTNQNRTVTATTSEQTIGVNTGYSGNGTITVNPVTASIDSNIAAGNIKDGVTILGVTGSVEELNATTLNVTPTTSAQTLSPASPYNGFDEVKVTAVTASIDPNIAAGNIKSGVSILGVSGTVTELNGEIKEEYLDSAAGNTFTPSTGKNAITAITVFPTNKDRTITATTSEQTIGIDTGYSGNGTITVNPVTASIDSNIAAGNIKSGVSILGVNGSVVELNGSTETINPSTTSQTVTPTSPSNGFTSVTVPAVTSSIDANIAAGNIKSGVSILGVAGTVTELNGTTLSVTPTTSAQSITPTSPNNGFTSVSVDAVTSSIDSNIQAANIKDGVTILGVTGTMPSGVKYGANIDCILGNPDSSGILGYPSGAADLVFTGIKDVIKSGLYYKFYYNQQLTSVSFPDLEHLTPEDACSHCFYACSGITSASLPKLEIIAGKNAAYDMFGYCTNLTSINLNSLTTISGESACAYMFYYSKMSSFSLPSLTTISGTSACNYMFAYNTTLTSADLSAVTTISGNQACMRMFLNCSSLQTVDLSGLTTISNVSACNYMFSNTALTNIDISGLTTITSIASQALSNAFQNTPLATISFDALSTIDGSYSFNGAFSTCKNLSSVYFRALTTTSFGSYTNQFSNMFNFVTASTSGTCTVHFPSNLETTVQGLTGYPLFGGTSGKIVLSFDLPATS